VEIYQAEVPRLYADGMELGKMYPSHDIRSMMLGKHG
jgi:hypothetical protein